MAALRSAIVMCLVCSAISGCGRPTLKSHGGYVLTYYLAPGQDNYTDHEQMAQAMQGRLRDAGIRDAIVGVSRDNGFTVSLPGAGEEEARRAEAMLAIMGILEMRILAERGQDDALIKDSLSAQQDAESTGIASRWVAFDDESVAPEDWMVFRDNRRGGREILVLISEDDVFGSDLIGAAKGVDDQLRPSIEGSLNPEGAFKMGMLTSSNIHRRLGIIFDDELISAPTIISQIDDRLQITGDFSSERVDSIILALRAGSFPARFEKTPASIEKIDPE